MSGYRTAEAATAAEALDLTGRLLPDVLLTDLVLPDLDGCAVAARVKDDARTAAVCVVLVTGHASDGLTVRAMRSGISRVLLKPCPPRTMLREIQRALDSRVSTVS